MGIAAKKDLIFAQIGITAKIEDFFAASLEKWRQTVVFSQLSLSITANNAAI
ncbi:MAG: hypothetical protein E7L01_12440 [Paenibacillus macerans]|uniref:Uncharacterized protein n=1 Tax=Paenibacillus macerans TaxID=44252 RepID=A0A6N8ETB4_PAEMA|nr:hypothetical protein [Paenibacillus macerans]MBS5912776.1 hypothetical protein [Paenibacillus macerans]MCY7557925.1 hypothetical protein [Paenibacillus macerans]MDU5946075.1 hypothetical protein [Paenibacillus macerans]MDU7474123.1 hypothetical protein [Paenibacillus macerans]MEC0141429.1 hypothetical protein [Paenibacillus macerans]